MGDSITKRLVIKASNNYDFANSTVVPVNCNQPVQIESEIGLFSLSVSIKNFDGSIPHKSNSLYNVGDKTYLDGSSYENLDMANDVLPNLRLNITFKPKYPIKGSDLLFGNDFLVPIKDYIPTTLLATGLKFFTWFINKTVKGDIYCDKPYLYGLALNSFTFMSIKDRSSNHVGEVIDGNEDKAPDLTNFVENLNDNIDNILKIPAKSLERKKYFTNLSNCENFVFNESTNYQIQFDSDYLKLADSKYAVSIPTFGNKTFDLNVSGYANDVLDNFNWTIKQGGYDGVGCGKLGLILNFALLNES